jgi:hypothetical protein
MRLARFALRPCARARGIAPSDSLRRSAQRASRDAKHKGAGCGKLLRGVKVHWKSAHRMPRQTLQRHLWGRLWFYGQNIEFHGIFIRGQAPLTKAAVAHPLALAPAG